MATKKLREAMTGRDGGLLCHEIVTFGEAGLGSKFLMIIITSCQLLLRQMQTHRSPRAPQLISFMRYNALFMGEVSFYRPPPL